MSWRERIESYADLQSVAGAKAEDFVSRKVLKGLGWSESKLPLLCAKAGVEWNENQPLWNTVKDILNCVSNGYFSQTSPTRRYIIDVRRAKRDGTFWKDRDEMSELEDVACSAGDGMILLGREPTDNPQGTACVFVKKKPSESFSRYGCLPYWLGTPVAVFREETEKSMIWVRRIEDLIRDMAETLNWDVPSLID